MEARDALLGTICAIVALSPFSQSALAAEQTKDQQACINEIAKGYARVAAAQGKLIAACVKAGAAEKLGVQSIDDCTTADNAGKVAKAEVKAMASIASKCTTAPDFGPSDLSGVTSNGEAIAARQALMTDLFGADLESAFEKKATNPIRARCQATVLKAADRCWKAYNREFNSCLKSGLKGKPTLIEDTAGIEACRNADPKRKVIKACREKFGSKADKSCALQDMNANMPGCNCQAPVACTHAGVGNALNPGLDTVHNLSPSAPVLPYVRSEVSDVDEPWVDLFGEYVAMLVVGREVDAPMECRIGAINSHTVQDPVADAQYNAGVTPLLAAADAKLIYVADDASDATGSSDPELVQPFQAMPWYRSATSLVEFGTQPAFHPLVPLKLGQVGDTLRFGLSTCLYDCEALEASSGFPIISFAERKLIVHFEVDRATLEASVEDLATDAAGMLGVELRWVGRVIAETYGEDPNGGIIPSISQPIASDGHLVYTLDALADPALVLASPTLSGLLAASSNEGVALAE